MQEDSFYIEEDVVDDVNLEDGYETYEFFSYFKPEQYFDNPEDF